MRQEKLADDELVAFKSVSFYTAVLPSVLPPPCFSSPLIFHRYPFKYCLFPLKITCFDMVDIAGQEHMILG